MAKTYSLSCCSKLRLLIYCFLSTITLEGALEFVHQKEFFVNSWQLVVKDFSVQFQIDPFLKLNETGKSVM